MIIRAAIRKNDFIYVAEEGQRHHHLLNDKSRPFGFLKLGEQGFVDDSGRGFYTRQEAAEHAFKCGQTKELINNLTSEDLW